MFFLKKGQDALLPIVDFVLDKWCPCLYPILMIADINAKKYIIPKNVFLLYLNKSNNPNPNKSK